MNVDVISAGEMPRSAIVGSHGNCMSSFTGNSQTFLGRLSFYIFIDNV